jgi:hypothetical protein
VKKRKKAKKLPLKTDMNALMAEFVDAYNQVFRPGDLVTVEIRDAKGKTFREVKGEVVTPFTGEHVGIVRLKDGSKIEATASRCRPTEIVDAVGELGE